MSWRSCSKIVENEPAERRAFLAIQDFFSIRGVGDLTESSLMRGLPIPGSMLAGLLELLCQHQALQEVVHVRCPNLECNEVIGTADGVANCPSCGQDYESDALSESIEYVLLEATERSPDHEWSGKAGFPMRFRESASNKVFAGDRVGAFILLEEDLLKAVPGPLLREGVRIFQLESGFFQPAFGQRKRGFLYKYTELTGDVSMGDTFDNSINLTMSGGTANIGSITHHGKVQKVGSEIEQALLLFATIRQAAAVNHEQNAKLIDVLDKALAEKNESTVKGTLRELVSFGADFTTVIAPFMPQIIPLLSALSHSAAAAF